MGTHTDFSGSFTLHRLRSRDEVSVARDAVQLLGTSEETASVREAAIPPTVQMTRAQVLYLRAFSESRRMRRDPALLVGEPDPKRLTVGLPLGVEGGYYVGHGRGDGPGVLNPNEPPKGQPGLWCGWTPTYDGDGIEWNGTEKFYHYTEWIRYLIKHFLKPWGYELNGEVWFDSQSGDKGFIVVNANKVSVRSGRSRKGKHR